jgi:flagellar assembly protein FliH
LSTDAAPFAFEQLQPVAMRTGAGGGGLGVSLADAERIHDEARAAGEAEGRAQGLLAAHAEIDSALAGLSRAAGEIGKLRDEMTERFEREAVDLALSLAEQIIAGTLDVQPERILDGVRGALRRLVDRHRVTILVNPADLELVSDRMEAIRAELGGIEQCDVQADRRVSRGGAVVETAAGEIDAQIDTQLARAREVVSEQLNREG